MYPFSRHLLTIVLLAGLVTAAAAGMAGVAGAQNGDDVTFVEGDVEEDTTWTAEDGPYRVIRDVHIEEGATLTIEPGTEVQVAEGRTLAVHGSFVANGTGSSPITIAMTPGASGDARWSTIRYVGTDGSTLTLANTTVRDARTGITVASDAGELSFRDTTIRDVSRHGIAVTDVPNVPSMAVHRSTFSNVGGHGIAATPASGSLEAISLATSTDEPGERTRHTLSLEPGVEVRTDELQLAYGDHGDVSGIDASDLARFGIDADEDADIDRSLTQDVASVSASDGTITISLSDPVRIRGDERLVLAVGGVQNPETRGIYRVDVTALDDGVSQLADGVHAPLSVGGISSQYAETAVVTQTTAESLSIRETAFEGVGGAGIRVEADRIGRLRISNSRFETIDGEGIGLRGRSIDGVLRSNRVSADDAGIQVTARDGIGHLRVVGNTVTASETGLSVRQSGSRVRATMGMTVEHNDFSENERYGVHVNADRGRLSGGSLADNVLRGNGRGGAAVSTSGVHGLRIGDNRVLDNGGDGMWIRTHRFGTTVVTGNEIAGNSGDGLSVRAFASVRDVSIRNATVADNGGHGLSIRTDLVAHELTVADSRLSNNAGAGVLVASPLTHGGAVDVVDNVVAANNYGVHLAGTLRANVSGNAIVYNTNEHATAVPLEGVEPGTAISIVEGPAGVVLDRGEADVPLAELVADQRIDLQLETVGPNADTAVVLRTDGQGHTRLEEAAALPVDSILADIPTGVALSTRGTETGVTVVENDVYDHPTGLAVDIRALIDANTTARVLVEDVRTVTAERTYWGAASGPFHDSILPSGEGDPIATHSGWVDFVPYAETAHAERYERPVPALAAPTETLPGETVTIDGSASTVANGTFARYHFAVDGASRSPSSDPILTVTMPDDSMTVGLAVEDAIGIDGQESATVTIEPAEPRVTTTAPEPTTVPSTTQPGTQESGLLGTILGVLGGLSYLIGVVLGAYGMWLTLGKRNPPYDGIVVHGFAIGGVVVWALGGLVVGEGLGRLALFGGAIWVVATGIAYVLASR